MGKFFLPEELQEILNAVATAGRKQQEQRRRGESVDRISETDTPTLGKVRDIVKTAVQTRVTSFLLSLLPRELASGIAGASLLGGIVPVVGAFAGFGGAIAIEQARRAAEREDKKLAAQIKSRGITADPNAVFIPPQDIDSIIREGTALTEQLKGAVQGGDVQGILRGLTRIATTGKASVAAGKAYSDALADWQGATRAKQAAFHAYVRSQGPYIPQALFEETKALVNRADRKFKDFHKDPPIKG